MLFCLFSLRSDHVADGLAQEIWFLGASLLPFSFNKSSEWSHRLLPVLSCRRTSSAV